MVGALVCHGNTQRSSHPIQVWLKTRYQKWSPGKRKGRLKPAIWRVSFEPEPMATIPHGRRVAFRFEQDGKPSQKAPEAGQGGGRGGSL